MNIANGTLNTEHCCLF